MILIRNYVVKKYCITQIYVKKIENVIKKEEVFKG